jgi:hypothetical protein
MPMGMERHLPMVKAETAAPRSPVFTAMMRAPMADSVGPPRSSSPPTALPEDETSEAQGVFPLTLREGRAHKPMSFR